MTDQALPPPLPPQAPQPPPPPPPRSDRDLLATPARQAPAALVFIAWKFVRQLGWSALAGFGVFAFRGPEGLGFGVLGVAVAAALLASSTLSWWRFTFQVVGDEMIVRRGVFSHERLVIPLDRVQSVSIDQRLLHKVLGLVSASVDTAGSAEAEFEIDAIDRPRAEALRRIASDARTAAPGTNPELGSAAAPSGSAAAIDEVLVRRSVGDLVLVGLSHAPLAGLLVLAPIAAYGDEFGLTRGIEGRIENSIDDIAWSAGLLLALVAGLIVILVLGALLQISREVVRNWELTLYRTPTGLRRTAGLFTTTSRSSTVRRVQAISTDDSPLQRYFGFTQLRLRTFGDNHLSLPGTRWHEVAAIRRLVLGTDDPPPLERRISRAAVFLTVRNTVLVVLPLTGLAFVAVRWWAAPLLVIVPVRWATARLHWSKRRWGFADGRLAEHVGLLVRRTTELPVVKTQVVTVEQSFFERRRGLATLHVQSAEGFVAIPLIPLADAQACRDRILHAVETDRRPFL